MYLKSITEGDKIEIVDGVVVSAPKGMRIYYEACEDDRYGTF